MNSLLSRYFPRLNKGISCSEQQQFFRFLADLTDAAVPVCDALEVIHRLVPGGTVQDAVREVQHCVMNGSALSEALAQQPENFSAFAVHLVRAGENAGQLSHILGQIAEAMEDQAAVRGRIQTALIYPALIILAGTIAVLGSLFLVVPRLVQLFEDMQAELPLPTRILIKLSEGSWVLAAGLAGLSVLTGGLVWRFRKDPRWQELRDEWLARLPCYGAMVKDVTTYHLCRYLALFLENGLVMDEAFAVVAGILPNSAHRRMMQQAAKDIEEGAGLAEALAAAGLLSLEAQSVLAVAQGTGAVDAGLRKLAAQYHRRIEERTRRFTQLLEPLFILVTGVLVGFIVLAMLLPLFRLNSLIL